MNGDRQVEVRPLTVDDADEVAKLIAKQTTEYLRFFWALRAEVSEIEATLRSSVRDLYFGLFVGDRLVSFFMLRGWDAGFEIPAFGIVVDKEFSGGRLLHTALVHAKKLTRRSGATKLMAKIHPTHVSSKGARRLGFYQIGSDEGTGNIIYLLDV